MKFALYIEPYRIYHSHFYTYKILIDEFINHGHILNCYTPIDYKIDSTKNTKKKKLNIDSIKKIYGISFTIGFPEPKDYDILLLESQYYKNWCDENRDMRTIIASKFAMYNKPIIVMNDSMLMETRIIPINNIIYGIASNDLLKINNKNNQKLSFFTMSPINYLINPKPNALTKEQFYLKYNLDPKLKIIAFLPGKLSKWQNVNNIIFNRETASQNYNINNQQIHWIINNCKIMVNILRKLGYQLVGKMHLRDFNKFKKDCKFSKTLMKNYITYITQFDTYELLQYADFAFTFGSTMVYQLYLYDLPSIELGTGFYFSGWAYHETTEFTMMEYIQKYDNGSSLIYGHIIDFNKFTQNMEIYLTNILNNKYEINKFIYKNNNPIYGNSYGKTIDKIYTNMIKISTVLYMKNKLLPKIV